MLVYREDDYILEGCSYDKMCQICKVAGFGADIVWDADSWEVWDETRKIYLGTWNGEDSNDEGDFAVGGIDTTVLSLDKAIRKQKIKLEVL